MFAMYPLHIVTVHLMKFMKFSLFKKAWTIKRGKAPSTVGKILNGFEWEF